MEGYSILPPAELQPDEEPVWTRHTLPGDSATLRLMNAVETMVKGNVDELVIRLEPATTGK